MKPYREMSKEELASLKEQLTAVYKEYQGKNLSLNMARGNALPRKETETSARTNKATAY